MYSWPGLLRQSRYSNINQIVQYRSTAVYLTCLRSHDQTDQLCLVTTVQATKSYPTEITKAQVLQANFLPDVLTRTKSK